MLFQRRVQHGLRAAIAACAFVALLAGPPQLCAQPVDERVAEAAGIRKLQGKHLTLYTDVRGPKWLEELPAVFDQAVLRWCEYFSINPQRAASWRVRATLIADMRQTKPFRAAGLLPADVPPFPAGFQRGNEIWLYLQEGDYSTRHLLLHEGTHAFMIAFTGGTGPPWYSEGMAELLALHRWTDGKLELKVAVRDKAEVPFWGRPKIIREDVTKRNAMTIQTVIEMKFKAFLNVRSYAWAWAACHFFDNHPEYQDRFRALRDKVRDGSDFNSELAAALQDQWSSINQQWLLFVTEMDYGYDVGAAQPKDAHRETSGDTVSVKVAADRGWQATGIHVEPGQQWVIDARGRFQVARRQQPWESEPQGVTIEYYRGRPLGMLLGAVVDPEEPVGFLRPVEIGTGGEFQFESSGQLYLRINDSPARWDDNQGGCEVNIRPK